MGKQAVLVCSVLDFAYASLESGERFKSLLTRFKLLGISSVG